MPNVEDAKTDRKVDHYNCIHNKAIQRGTAALARRFTAPTAILTSPR